MKSAIMVGIVAAMAVFLTGCDSPEPEAKTDDPQYKLGYEAGHADGINDGQIELCRQIERFKDSMAEALKDENICPR